MSLTAKLVVGVIVAAALLPAYTALATWRVEQRYPPQGEFITVEGIRLHYTDEGSGPPIVLLHGASASLRDFQASLIPGLAKHHRVIAFDRPGYGYSERPAGAWLDPAQQAALVSAALAKLEVEQPLVVGHSWSGAVVLAYMLNHPADLAGGVLLAGAANPWDSGVSWHVDLARRPVLGRIFAGTAVFPIGQLGLNKAIDGVFAPETPTPDYRQRTGAILALRPGPFRTSAEDVGNLSRFLAEQTLRYDGIAAPLLMVTGGADTVVSAQVHTQRLAARLPHAEWVDLPGAGHALHHSRTEDVVTLIRGFFERVQRRVVVGSGSR